ncbi:MAG: toxin [Bacteroidota bacterium]
MTTRHEVETFLSDFKLKMRVFQILFRDERMKNTQSLLHLEMTPGARKKVIEGLTSEDYSEGPLTDTLYDIASTWVFGKNIHKGMEIYIKISMGRPNQQVICISFHLSEHPMSYPFNNPHKA